MRCDLFPPKLVKIGADQLEEPLTYISFQAKPNMLISVKPVDYGGNDKHTFLKYRPTSVLNTFSRIIECHFLIKLSYALIHSYQFFIGAYFKRDGTQHVYILEEWRVKCDQCKVTGGVLLGLFKSFSCFPRYLLIAKLNAHGIDREALQLS